MPSPVTRLSFFDIWKDNHSAVYNYRVDKPVEPDGHEELIRQAVENDALPNGGSRPRRDPARRERYLDVAETQEGHCVYVFRLDHIKLDKRLAFVKDKEPLVPLPTNSVGDENFITAVKHWGTDGLWASFACDLDYAKSTELAGRIRKNAHGHPPILMIPFYFNVFDPELGASPWVVPNHPHGHQQSQQAEDLVTHGGVHPPEVVYLTVPV